MTWVRRGETSPVHNCDLPMREAWCTVPPPSPLASGARPDTPSGMQRLRLPDVPNGQRGDLWRCDACGRLWRVDYRPDENRGGHRAQGLEWLPASWWQRLRHRPEREGSTP